MNCKLGVSLITFVMPMLLWVRVASVLLVSCLCKRLYVTTGYVVNVMFNALFYPRGEQNNTVDEYSVYDFFPYHQNSLSKYLFTQLKFVGIIGTC